LQGGPVPYVGSQRTTPATAAERASLATLAAIGEIVCGDDKCVQEKAKAEEAFAQGVAKAGEGAYDKAIDSYKKAWQHAMKANGVSGRAMEVVDFTAIASGTLGSPQRWDHGNAKLSSPVTGKTGREAAFVRL